MNAATRLFSMLALVAGQPAMVWGPPSRAERIVRRYNPNAPPGSAYNPVGAVQSHPDWKPQSRQIRRARERAARKATASAEKREARRLAAARAARDAAAAAARMYVGVDVGT